LIRKRIAHAISFWDYTLTLPLPGAARSNDYSAASFLPRDAPAERVFQILPGVALLDAGHVSGVPAPPPSAHLGPPDQRIILGMRADPEPLEAILAFDGDCAVPAANTRRPQVSTDALEVQRRMLRIALQQSEVPVCDRTNIGRQGIE
jgi:hypothetical protein